jgi:hypothetical protein
VIPPAPVLLKILIVQQKSSIGRFYLKSARRNFKRNWKTGLEITRGSES